MAFESLVLAIGLYNTKTLLLYNKNADNVGWC